MKIVKMVLIILGFIVVLGIIKACVTPSPTEIVEETAVVQDTTSKPDPTVKPTATVKPEPAKKAEAKYEITYNDFNIYTSISGTDWVQIIFAVENTGDVPLFLSSGAADISDGDGKLLLSQTMISAFPQIIAPGETGYYYDVTTIDVGNATKAKMDVRPKVDAAKVDYIRMQVSDTNIALSNLGLIETTGWVENVTDEKQTLVYVASVYFDEDDNPIGLAFTIILEDMLPKDKIGFKASMLTMPPDMEGKLSYSKTFAYPNQFQF